MKITTIIERLVKHLGLQDEEKVYISSQIQGSISTSHKLSHGSFD